MSLYAIADLHLSFGVDKPMDIFGGWENHVERLTENWNRLVTPEDTVIIPGDISWGIDLNEAREDFLYLESLPGKKIVGKGNHDLWFSTRTKVENFFKENNITSVEILFNNAFEYGDYVLCGTRGWINETGAGDKKVLLREQGRLRRSLEEGLKTGKEPLVFLHYPPIFGSSECIEIVSVLKEFNIKRVYYGHLHGYSHQYAINGERMGIEFQLISGDFLQFCPKKIV